MPPARTMGGWFKPAICSATRWTAESITEATPPGCVGGGGAGKPAPGTGGACTLRSPTLSQPDFLLRGASSFVEATIVALVIGSCCAAGRVPTLPAVPPRRALAVSLSGALGARAVSGPPKLIEAAGVGSVIVVGAIAGWEVVVASKDVELVLGSRVVMGSVGVDAVSTTFSTSGFSASLTFALSPESGSLDDGVSSVFSERLSVGRAPHASHSPTPGGFPKPHTAHCHWLASGTFVEACAPCGD